MASNFDITPGDPHIRYGLYLRPSFAMARTLAEFHELALRQFGQTRAGKYMPHATIGFFDTEATVAELVAAIDPVCATHAPFTIVNNGLVPLGNSFVLDINHLEDRGVNAALHAFHDDAHAALYPLTDHTDRFHWTGEGFFAHMTLVQRVRPAALYDEIHAFLREAEPIGPRRFRAQHMHLYAIRSDDWNDEEWSDSLTWTFLHSWNLGNG